MATALRTEIGYQFLIGTAMNITTESFDPDTTTTYYYTDYLNEKDANAFIFTEHRISFSVTASSKSSNATQASITLYNAPDDVVTYVNANKDKHVIACLWAGDNVTGLGKICAGEITGMTDSWSDGTRVTNFIMNDGSMFLKNGFTSKQFASGTSKQEIVSSLLQDLKLPVKQCATIDGTVKGSKTYFGSTHKILTGILEDEGFRLNIINGETSVMPKDGRIEIEASYISNQSGLIGRITPVVNNSNNTTVSSSGNNGVSFTCLLDPALHIEDTVYLYDEPSVIDGAYKLTKLVFEGDTESTKWICNCIADKVTETVTIVK